MGMPVKFCEAGEPKDNWGKPYFGVCKAPKEYFAILLSASENF